MKRLTLKLSTVRADACLLAILEGFDYLVPGFIDRTVLTMLLKALLVMHEGSTVITASFDRAVTRQIGKVIGSCIFLGIFKTALCVLIGAHLRL